MEIGYIKICGKTKAALRQEFIALNAYIGKEEKSQISNQSSHLKNLEKGEQNKSKGDC